MTDPLFHNEPEDYIGPIDCRCGYTWDNLSECPRCQAESLAAEMVDELTRLTIGFAEDHQAFQNTMQDNLVEDNELRLEIASKYGTDEFDVVSITVFMRFMDEMEGVK